MPQQNDRDLRLAVLIDADNASRTAMRDVMACLLYTSDAADD